MSSPSVAKLRRSVWALSSYPAQRGASLQERRRHNGVHARLDPAGWTGPLLQRNRRSRCQRRFQWREGDGDQQEVRHGFPWHVLSCMKGAYLRRGELRAAGPNFVDVSLRRVEYPSYFRSHHCGGLPTCRQLLFVTASKPVTPQSVIFSNSRHLFTRFRHQGALAQALP